MSSMMNHNSPTCQESGDSTEETQRSLELKEETQGSLEVKEDSNDDDNASCSKSTNKRKRKVEETLPIENVISIFLRIMYPLSRYMTKFVVVGVDKNSDYKPVVLISQNGKTLTLHETAWISLAKRMQLLECYLANSVFGKKTSFGLVDSDIEVDNIKLRGSQYVRLRDLTKHDVKVQLNYEEFSLLYSSSSAITNYIKQLNGLESCTKDYIIETTVKHPTSQLVYSPVDSSILNRLPQEVYLFRRMNLLKNLLDEEEKENISTAEEEEESLDIQQSVEEEYTDN